MSDWNDGPPAEFERGMEIRTGKGAVFVLGAEGAGDVHGAYTSDGEFTYLSEVSSWRWPGPAQPDRSETEARAIIASAGLDPDEVVRDGMALIHRLKAETERSESVDRALTTLHLARDMWRAARVPEQAMDDCEQALIEAVRDDERAKLEKAHMARLREEAEKAWNAGTARTQWLIDGRGQEPTNWPDYLLSRRMGEVET